MKGKRLLYALAGVVVLIAVAASAGCGSGTTTTIVGTVAANAAVTTGVARAATEAASPTSTAPDTTAPSPLVLSDSGYVVVDGPFVEYGFILKNPNAGFGAEFPAVRITMRDDAGGILGTDEQVLISIMPGESVAWGGQADPNGKKPAKVEFEVLDPGDDWKPADQMEPVGFKPFTIEGLQKNTSDFGTSFTGELVNPNAVSFDQVAVSVLLRDEAGKIVVGYTDFVEKLQPNGKAPFEVDSVGEVPLFGEFEAYAQPWQPW